MDEAQPGYPVDRRTGKQRGSASRSVPGDFERSAARVVARYTGERVLLTDDGSVDSMPDIEIEYDDGRVGVVEVVLDMDPAWAAMYAAVREREFNIEATGLTHLWFVWLKPDTKVNSLDDKLVQVLGQLEDDGWPVDEHIDVADVANASPEVQYGACLLADLGVHAASSHLGPAPKIRLVPSGMGGALEGWPAFQSELARILHSEKLSDVRRKLEKADADERHAFLGVTSTSSWSLSYWLADRQTELPPSPPTLPAEVTHIWVWRTPGRVLGWFPDRGWFDPSTDWATP